MQMKGKTHALLPLDALRGVAAILVVCYHFKELFGGQWVPHGYLAVDFFFMLSGFVLTLAYQNKLDAGWSTWELFKLRIARLYPLYLVGLLLGAFYSALLHFAGRSSFSPMLLILALLFVPRSPTRQPTRDSPFPLDGPTWSLYFEIVANVLHAILLRRRSLRFLASWLAVLGFVYIALIQFGPRTIDVGSNRHDLLYGLARVSFPYLLGAVLFHLWKRGQRRLRLNSVVALLLLVFALTLPVPARMMLGYGWAMILVVFPLLIFASASTQAPVRLAPFYRYLGESSYAVYVIHYPLQSYFEAIWKQLRGHAGALDAPWSGISFLVLVLSLAFILDRFYDAPAREWLKSKLVKPTAVGKRS